jgi:hypothetical protein
MTVIMSAGIVQPGSDPQDKIAALAETARAAQSARKTASKTAGKTAEKNAEPTPAK